MRLLLIRGAFQVFSAQDVGAEAKAWQIASAVRSSTFDFECSVFFEAWLSQQDGPNGLLTQGTTALTITTLC